MPQGAELMMNFLKVLPVPFYGQVAVLLATFAAGAGGAYQVQAWRYGEQIGQLKERVSQERQMAAQDKTAALQSALAETVRLQGVKDEAIHQAERKALSNAAALQQSRAESVRLRDELASARSELSGSTCDSVRAYANAGSVVLDQCSGAYQDLAGKADGHAAAVELMIAAWPRVRN